MEQGKLFDHTVEDLLRCEIAVLVKENKVLREDNNTKAMRIHQMECDAEAYRFQIKILEARLARAAMKLREAGLPHPWKGSSNGTERSTKGDDSNSTVR